MSALIPYVPPFRATGSHGMFSFDTFGRVLEFLETCDCGECHNGYRDILVVDVGELRTFYAAHWPRGLMVGETLDILEIGWWSATGCYVPAANDWRLDMLNRCRDGVDA